MKFMNKLIFGSFFILPFLPAFDFFKTQEINYFAYYAIIITCFVFIKILLNDKITIDQYLIYWIWYFFITLISWSIWFIIKNYYYLIYPFTAISLYIILKYYCNYRDYGFFVKIFLSTAVIQSLIGISQSFFGYPIFENITPVIFESERNYLAFIFPSISSVVKQGTGTFEHFNGLGAYLAIALPISYGYWKSDPSIKSILILTIITIGVITTFSRGALIGSILGIIYIYVLSSKNKLKIFLLIVLVVAAIIFLWGILVSYYQKTQNFTIREYTWSFALSSALQNPLKLLYGYGPFYFREKLLGLGGTITNLHSGQLQILLELGIIGFLIFISLFKYALVITSKYKNNLAIVSITGGMIAFFVHQIFDNSFFGNTGILWFTLLALVFTIKENNIFITTTIRNQ